VDRTTTNAVEALHRQFRKATKSKSLFPNDEAVTRILFLEYKNIARKWTSPLQNRALVISQLSIFFKERLHGNLQEAITAFSRDFFHTLVGSILFWTIPIYR